MKEVYIVTKLCDFEYGCRKIEKVFENEKNAFEYIEKQEDNEIVEFWNGLKDSMYVVETWDVE